MDYPLIDKFKKTVKLPIKYKDGKMAFLFDESISLQEIVNEIGAGEIVFPAFFLKNPKLEKILNEEISIDFLSEGFHVYCSLYTSAQYEKIDDKKFFRYNAKTSNGLFSYRQYKFAIIELREEIKLRYRGTKEPQLSKCKCYIPALEKEAISLNQAYTLLSQEFQKHRNAHTGNVFSHIFYFDKAKNNIEELEKLRREKSGELNQLLIHKLRDSLEK